MCLHVCLHPHEHKLLDTENKPSLKVIIASNGRGCSSWPLQLHNTSFVANKYGSRSNTLLGMVYFKLKVGVFPSYVNKQKGWVYGFA